MDSFKFQKKMERLRARSPSRSRSPRKKSTASTSTSSFSTSPRKKTLERRTTDGTSPLSDYESIGSIGSMTNVEMLIMETSWRRPGHTAERRFASNGCEIIQGIQDPAAIQAWAARSPRGQAVISPTTNNNDNKNNRRSSSRSRPKRPNLTIDTDIVDGESRMNSAVTSVGSPIQPSSRSRAIQRISSPTKRIDPSGDFPFRNSSKRRSTPSSGTNTSPQKRQQQQELLSSSSCSSSTASKSAIERALYSENAPKKSGANRKHHHKAPAAFVFPN
jgi:hypothetical protein